MKSKQITFPHLSSDNLCCAHSPSPSCSEQLLQNCFYR